MMALSGSVKLLSAPCPRAPRKHVCTAARPWDCAPIRAGARAHRPSRAAQPPNALPLSRGQALRRNNRCQPALATTQLLRQLVVSQRLPKARICDIYERTAWGLRGRTDRAASAPNARLRVQYASPVLDIHHGKVQHGAIVDVA